MIQAFQQPITFDEFIAELPERSECRYELHRGVVVEMPKPRGRHSKIAGNLAYELGAAIRQQDLSYFIPRECIVRSWDGYSGYEPDVIVLNESALGDEPQWESGSIVTLGNLVNGEYELQQFRSGDRLVSPTFPDLALRVDQLLATEG